MAAWLWRGVSVPGRSETLPPQRDPRGARLVDAPPRPGAPPPSPAAPGLQRARRTLAAPGPWLVALAFAVYAGQWMTLIGFLPTVYAGAGVGAAAAGALTAAVAAVNMLGNLGAGRLMHRGMAPAWLLQAGFAVMGLMALAAFARVDGTQLPAQLRFTAVLLFSAVGGVVPATLFALAVRLAPGEDTIATAIGWVQQWSSLGQFALPPLAAWVAVRSGGWHWTGVLMAGCALLGWLLAQRIQRLLQSDRMRQNR
jgi:MFS family permease